MKLRMNSIDKTDSPWLIVLAGFLILGLAGCEVPRDEMLHLSGQTMGTTYHVKIVGLRLTDDDGDGGKSAADNRMTAEALAETIDQRLVDLNGIFSTYIPNSEISVLNRSSGTLKISQEMHHVLTLAWQIHALSDGAYDITVGPLVNLWGFGPDGPADGIPDQAAIAEALARVGLQKLQLGPDSLTKPSNISIDLSSLAKGYAVEQIAALVEELGASRYMVEIGGEVKTKGVNQRGRPWMIGVETPDMNVRQVLRVIPLRDAAMATSGDYRNFFEVAGQTYSHTLNPQTGWPVTHNLASVTVIDDDAGFADAIATAFSVLGPTDTMRIANQKNLRVFAILRTGRDEYEERYSDRMQAYLSEHRINGPHP